jgi:tetratricopeptide (TPR) repeat protein
MAATDEDGVCKHCGKPGATERCSRCRAAYYCDRRCQKADWRAWHKQLCSTAPETAAEAHPTEAAATAALKTLGDACFRARDFNGALRHYDAAIALTPAAAVLHSARSAALSNLGRGQLAQAAAERGLTIDAGDATLWYNMGVTGGGTVDGVAHGKVACCEHALAIDPQYVLAWSMMGVAGGGTVDGVAHGEVACYEHVLAIDPRHVNAWSNMGVAGGGTVDGVAHGRVACFEHAVAIDAGLVESWSNLGNAGGGTVGGVARSLAMCFGTALRLAQEQGRGDMIPQLERIAAAATDRFRGF